MSEKVRPRILVFDSGLGGLSVVGELRRQSVPADIIYGADQAAFPIGSWEEGALRRRIVQVIGQMSAVAAPDLVIIACNTASTLALDLLRDTFQTPFVGTVPAIKPAAKQSRSKIIGVLATPGTAKRDYTKDLIAEFAGACEVVVHGADDLACLAEERLLGGDIDQARLLSQISPAFVTRGDARTDVVVLACTHYPLIAAEIRSVAPWPVEFIDPSEAIVRRAVSILPPPATERSPGLSAGTFLTTAPVSADDRLRRIVGRFGFRRVQIVPFEDGVKV